jgi:hypothetical protein
MCEMRMFLCEVCHNYFRDPEGTVNVCQERVFEYLEAKEAGQDVGPNPKHCPPINEELNTYPENLDKADMNRSKDCPECNNNDEFWG